MPDRRRTRGWANLLWILPLIAIVVLTAGLTSSGSVSAPRHPPDPHSRREGREAAFAPPAPVSAARVFIRATVTGSVRSPLPRSFLGLSFEYWDVAAFDSHPAVLRRLVGLLRVPGDGPVLLRIGGDSASQAYWGHADPGIRFGPWPFHITAHWLSMLAAIVRADHVRVLLDLNMAPRSPAMAAGFARAAVRRLPKGSVAAFEVGNEPDVVHRWVDYHLAGRAALFVAVDRRNRFAPSQYAQTFGVYARALARVAPSVPLAGPESAAPLRNLSWEQSLLTSDRSRVGLLTIHRYPLSACARPGSAAFSTITRVLSPRVSARLQTLSPALQLAHQARLPLRMTELNSVTCEGRRGVSNTFATALWAPDALFSLWKAGLAGANIHVRQDAINAAFWMSNRGLVARPLLYGLMLFARALGDRGQLARLKVGLTDPQVRLWAVRSGRRLNVVVLDKGPHPAHLALRAPGGQPAVVQSLSAPSIQSTTGVTLAGQTLGASGKWVGRQVFGHVYRTAGRYRLTVPAYSAALLSFSI